MIRCGRFLLITVSCGLPILSSGCGGGNVAAPTSFAKYNADNGDFAFEYPDGWDVSGFGKKNHVVKITKGGATITVQSDLTGSLIGDIAGSAVTAMTGTVPGTGLDAEATEDLEPVAQVHQMAQEAMAEEFGNYSEGEPEKVTPTLGNARMSEFTAKTGFGQEIRGIRATVLARDKRVVVICTCSASNWEALKPAFKKVIESLQYGQAKT
jgi:hypothetical protein